MILRKHENPRATRLRKLKTLRSVITEQALCLIRYDKLAQVDIMTENAAYPASIVCEEAGFYLVTFTDFHETATDVPEEAARMSPGDAEGLLGLSASAPLPAAASLVEPVNQLSRIRIHQQHSIEKGHKAPFSMDGGGRSLQLTGLTDIFPCSRDIYREFPLILGVSDHLLTRILLLFLQCHPAEGQP